MGHGDDGGSPGEDPEISGGEAKASGGGTGAGEVLAVPKGSRCNRVLSTLKVSFDLQRRGRRRPVGDRSRDGEIGDEAV